MSKVFNMVGGGGKNISYIIITGLESTDTVTCTKDGKSYPATWDETAQHWEIVWLPLGTFTVTATNGTKTTTETVLIDIAGVYEIEMDYKLWLYKDGDECEAVTGGWFVSEHATKNNTYMTLVGVSYQYDSYVATKNEINLQHYSQICFDMDANVSPDDNSAGGVGSSTNVAPHGGWVDKTYYNGGRTIVKVPILTNGNLYIGAYYGYNNTVNIYNVWVE